MVRRAGRLFVTAAALRVPVFSVVLRRGYGLGAMALTAGHFHAPVATAAWPSGEFGPMGIEGSVRLGFRKELEAAAPEAREALFERLVAAAIDKGQALNVASHLELDDVIDEMIKIKQPVMVDVAVKQDENCFPMIPSGAAHTDMILGPEDQAERRTSEEGMVLV